MKKLNGLDKYVIFSIGVTLIYTVAEFITPTITGIEKTTLTTAVYGFWAGEMVILGLIKIFKIKRE
jgi:ABC-type Fe3+ transport system permease subunit